MIAEDFEKANTAFTGLYQLVFQEFAKHVLTECQWINKEEDAGISGLRTAKEDWNPDFLVRKYSVKAA